MDAINTVDDLTRYCTTRIDENDRYIKLIDNYPQKVNAITQAKQGKTFDDQYIRNVRNKKTFNIMVVDALVELAAEVKRAVKDELLAEDNG